LPRHLRTVTPENVAIDYELAGVASRSAAALIDILLQAVGILVLMLLRAVLEATAGFVLFGWSAALTVSIFLLMFGYPVYFETVWNGQTPGKRLLRLRVVKYGGTPIDLPCASIRGLIRLLDMAFFLVGVFAILVTPRNQRLGDLAAGTLVVKERSEWKGDLAQPKKLDTQQHPEAELVKNVELVTPEQFEMAKRFIERSADLKPQLREELASRIALPLMQQLGIDDRAGIVYSNLISAVYDRCVHDRGMR
jgi:uncharacterized RDD family membrane protein YckC